MSSGMYGSTAPIAPGMEGRMSATFGGAPILELKRGWGPRILWALLIVLLVLPGFLGCVAMVFEKPIPFAAIAITGLASAGFGALFAWLFFREFGRQTTLYEQGIEQIAGGKTRAVPWNEVQEIWIAAQKMQAGGLLFIAGRAIMEAAKGKDNQAQLDEKKLQITLRIIGNDPKGGIKCNSYDKGVSAAFNAALGRVNPRLVAEFGKKISSGQTVEFGKTVKLSREGIAFGKKAPVAFGDIEKLQIDNGFLTVRKGGKWLSAGSAPVSTVPNIYVLTALFNDLAPGKADVGSGMSLAMRVNV